MTVQASPSSMERELEFRKKLTPITNQINAAESIPHILMTLKDKILELLEAERLTIYAIDTKNQELYSLQKIGDVPKEIRVPKSFASIAGFTALARKTINIKDAYEASELQRFHANLRFDQRWDKQTGFRTKSVLAVPILFEKYLLGVVQLINKKHGPAFTSLDEDAAEEIARILGIAFYNQHRVTRQTKPSKFGLLIDKGVVSEKDLEQAVSNARVNNINVEKVLIDDYNVPREEIGRSLAAYYSSQWFNYDGAQSIPTDLRDRVAADIWKKHGAAPVERRPGLLVVAVEDPQDLTRLDGIRAMNLAPRYEFWVAMRHEIMAYIATSYGEKQESESTTDSRRSGEDPRLARRRGEGRDRGHHDSAEPEIDETDSGIVKLANQLIIEAFARGASDIHVEPDGPQQSLHDPPAHRRRLPEVHGSSRSAPQRARAAPQDHGQARHLRAPQAAGRQDPLQVLEGNDRAARRHHPDGERQRRRRHAYPRRVEAAAAREDGLQRSEPGASSKRSSPSRTASVSSSVPTGSGKTTTLHSALGFINTEDMKIWTAEDPVEITQKGLRQVQVQPKIDFTFAAAMRSFLRADPDVIMVGEMRDHETAAIGIEASLTGHLVFSTLHTNSAPETITRLLDMNIDPFNFADALLGIMAQRLIRVLCTKCKEGYHPTPEEFEEIIEAYGYEYWPGTGITYSADMMLYRPKGCPACIEHRLQRPHGRPRAARRHRRTQESRPKPRPHRRPPQTRHGTRHAHADAGRGGESVQRRDGHQAGKSDRDQVTIGRVEHCVHASSPR